MRKISQYHTPPLPPCLACALAAWTRSSIPDSPRRNSTLEILARAFHSAAPDSMDFCSMARIVDASSLRGIMLAPPDRGARVSVVPTFEPVPSTAGGGPVPAAEVPLSCASPAAVSVAAEDASCAVRTSCERLVLACRNLCPASMHLVVAPKIVIYAARRTRISS